MCFGLDVGASALNWKKLYGICAEAAFCSYSLVKILQVEGSGSYIAGLIAVGLFGSDLFFRGEEIYDEYKLEQKKTDKKAMQKTKQEIEDPRST